LLDKLEFLLALARERHFGRAAEACGVTQPTLSAGLKQLEESLGLLLVTRGSRQEARALKQGHLVGHIRLAAIPTALAMVSALTTPYRERHPDVRFTVRSCTSIEVLTALDNLEVDAGISYLDNEPIGRLRSIPLYREQYRLLIAADSPLGNRKEVTWAEVGKVPLCLLTPDMQNRRIINDLLRQAGIEDPAPTLESNSMIVLFSHVKTGRWASVMPALLAETLGLGGAVQAIPIVDPIVEHTIGLLVPNRDPMAPTTAALVTEAQRVAPLLDRELAMDR
jgi:DNA-binding transcriptional LysR family regulator